MAIEDLGDELITCVFGGIDFISDGPQINEKSFNSITVDSDMSTNDMVCFFSTREILNKVKTTKDKVLHKLWIIDNESVNNLDYIFIIIVELLKYFWFM